MPIKPFLRENRERESEIGRLRIAKKLTLKQVQQLTGVSVGTFLALQNGTMGPIQKNGEIRSTAKKLMDFFDTTPEIAFPRYFCKIKPATKKVVLMQQLLDAGCSHGDHRKDPETLLIKKQEIKQLRMFFAHLTVREEMVIREHMHGKKLWEIGEKVDLSRERIRQIIIKSYRKIRRCYDLQKKRELERSEIHTQQ
jgi:DNA-directed RNA polymerase specialized sigma subunit